MAYLDQLPYLEDEQLLKRVSCAVVKAAQAIRNEAGGTPSHAARVRLATQATNSDDAMRVQFTRLMVIAAATPVTPSSTDGQLDTAVSDVWNTLAGE